MTEIPTDRIADIDWSGGGGVVVLSKDNPNMDAQPSMLPSVELIHFGLLIAKIIATLLCANDHAKLPKCNFKM